uniref:Uncharacterized protein n=1 Tax=Lepeophtheirus salmonis TaxID=72036 RepID=A0A0K2TAF7_LEPSM
MMVEYTDFFCASQLLTFLDFLNNFLLSQDRKAANH